MKEIFENLNVTKYSAKEYLSLLHFAQSKMRLLGIVYKKRIWPDIKSECLY